MAKENKQIIQVRYLGKEFDKPALVARAIRTALGSLNLSDLMVAFALNAAHEFKVTFSNSTDEAILKSVHQSLLTIQGLEIPDTEDVA